MSPVKPGKFGGGNCPLPEHPYFHPTTRPLLLAGPPTLRARVTKDEQERFCLGSHLPFSFSAVDAAYRFNDTSCMQLLIDHGLADYNSLLDRAAYDDFWHCHYLRRWLARPPPGVDSRGGHNWVLKWLLAYPPRHVVQAMLVMWGRLSLHPRLLPLCDWSDWNSRDDSESCDNMLILAACRGHPASLQTIDELRMMVEILTDDLSGAIIPEARQPLSHALRIARGMASMWPGTRPLVAEYLQSVCTWEDNQSSSSGDRSANNINSPYPPPAPPLILPPQDPVLHRLIDLKTYDEMLEPKHWLMLQHAWPDRHLLMWQVSTVFLANEEAARRMHCFKRALRGLYYAKGFTYCLLLAAGAFCRWRCVDVVLGEFRGKWPGGLLCIECSDRVLCRAIHDAVHGEPGCADGRIIRKLLQTDTRNVEDFNGIGMNVMPSESTLRGGWFGWEPFRQAFVERQQDCEHRETPACMEMRDAVLGCLSIFEQKALNILVGEPSKALFRASTRRRLKRLTDEGERGKCTGEESHCGESRCESTTSGRSSNSSGQPF